MKYIAIIPLKPYSLEELAAMYGICEETMIIWLFTIQDELGDNIGYTYNISQVRTILEKFGIPSQSIFCNN